MSPENTPTETSTNKAQAIVELNQNAALTDMPNDRYETTLASIEAAHSNVGQTPAEVEAKSLIDEFEAHDDTLAESSNAAALAAERQRLAAHHAIDMSAASSDSNIDEDRLQAAHAAVDKQYAEK